MAHLPVLLKEIIEILNPQPGEFFIDGTLGGSGHAVEILKRILPKGKLLGIDWDKELLESARKNIQAIFGNDSRIIFVHGNYADLPVILKKQKLGKANGLLLDLGFSSEQLTSGRGFSFQKDEPLNMRYNILPNVPRIKSDASRMLTAAEIINSFSENDLADIFYKYGEERFSRQIAKKIVVERRKKRIKTALDLAEVVRNAVPRNYERGRIHPATKVFQSLRIYVNNELKNLEKVLKDLNQIIKIKGRVAIISFHSLEDRKVKNTFRDMAKKRMAKILTKKPIRASWEEIGKNPRSRSAKLRAVKITN